MLNGGILNPVIRSLLARVRHTWPMIEASFKPRVPRAIGLIRTGDNTQYGNVILVSA